MKFINLYINYHKHSWRFLRILLYILKLSYFQLILFALYIYIYIYKDGPAQRPLYKPAWTNKSKFKSQWVPH